MATIGSLLVKLGMNTSAFDRGSKRANKSLYGLQRQVAKTQLAFAKAAVVIAGAYGVGRITKSLVDAASTAEETQSKFNTVFKSLAKDANKWSEDFGQSVGRASQDVKKWMAGLQDTFVPLGIARKEAYDLSKSLTTLAVDVASFNNVADADVIRDFTSALVGNHETVRKFGIIISENALKQEAMAQGIQKTYSELTDLEKVQLRYSLILKGTTDAQGDAIRTGNSYANQVKRLTANITNLKEALGKGLLPVFAAGVTKLNEELTKTNNMAQEMQGKYTAVFKGLTIGVLTVVNGVKILVGGFKNLISTILGLGSVALGVFAKWAKAIEFIQNQLVKFYNLFIKLHNKIAGTKLGKKIGFDKHDLINKKEYGSNLEAYAKAMNQTAEKMRDESRGTIKDGLSGLWNIAEVDSWFDNLNKKTTEFKNSTSKTSNTASSAVPTIDFAKVTNEAKAQIESIRNMQYLTRRERIIMLQEYVKKNKEALDQVASAHKLLNDEIKNLEESRVNQWKVYLAELREDMQDFGLFAAEKMVSAADSIESAFSDAFYSAIEEGKNFKEVMGGLADSIRQSFTRMFSDMIARAMMAKLMGGAFGGMMGGMFAGAGAGAAASSASVGSAGVDPSLATGVHVLHGGGKVGSAGGLRNVAASAFANAPRFHDGLMPNEMATILEKGEWVLPKDVTRSMGSMGSDGGRAVYFTVNALDARSVTDMLKQNGRAIASIVQGQQQNNHTLRRYDR